MSDDQYSVLVHVDEEDKVLYFDKETTAEELRTTLQSTIYGDTINPPYIRILYDGHSGELEGDTTLEEIFDEDYDPIVGIIEVREGENDRSISVYRISVTSVKLEEGSDSDEEEQEYIEQARSDYTVDDYIDHLKAHDFLNRRCHYETRLFGRQVITDTTKQLCNFVDIGEELKLCFRALPPEVNVIVECIVHPLFQKKRKSYRIEAVDRNIVQELISTLNLPSAAVMIHNNTCMRRTDMISQHSRGKTAIQVKVLPDIDSDV